MLPMTATSQQPAADTRISLATMAPAELARPRRVRLVNVLLPGGGLVSQDRVLLGVVLGLACWGPLTVAAYVAWIEPGALPVRTVMVLAGAGMLAYLLGQWLLARMLDSRARREADYAAGTVPLLTAAYEQMSRGDYIQAQIHLDALLAFDREQFEGNLLQARLLAVQGKADQAREAYARCRRLDAAGRWEWEIGRELGRLSS
ncbi:MAG: hypothetical protein PHU85_02585 [Phycisphaerae bacterium]|nr:hypothetical protein [Phycisphaerae bacterium]